MRSLPVSLAHVSHFSEPEPWAYKQWTHFSVFEIFKMLQLPALLLSLRPRVALLDAFSALSSLFGSFLLYLQAGSEASVYADMDIETSRLRSMLAYLPAFEISKMFSFASTRPYFLPGRVQKLSVRGHSIIS